MLIKENELRKYIKKLLKENESDTAIEINNTTTFNIADKINELGEQIQINSISDIINILTKVQNIFKLIETKIKDQDKNKKVVLSSTSCSICKNLYKHKKDNIIYIIIDNDLYNPEIITSYAVYQQLYNHFKDMWKSWNLEISYSADYVITGDTITAEEDYKSDQFFENWRHILQVCSLLKASTKLDEKIDNSIKKPIALGVPAIFESCTALINTFDTAIQNLNNLQNSLNKPKKPSLREIKIKISKTLFEIYNYFCKEKEKKSNLTFFDFLRKFAAQYSENKDVENIIDVFEKSLSDKVNNLTVKNFYNVNSFVFQHRSKEEKKVWLKFISWLRKRYKIYNVK